MGNKKKGNIPFGNIDLARPADRRRVKDMTVKLQLQTENLTPVSYTHLDVYKRQGRDHRSLGSMAIWSQRMRSFLITDTVDGGSMTLDIQ